MIKCIQRLGEGTVNVPVKLSNRRVITGIARWLFVLSIIIVFQACASKLEPRPKSMNDAEYLQQQGTAAYYNDEYSLAAEYFVKALDIYQSIDNYSGIIESTINVVETSIAVGNFTIAHQYLQQLNKRVQDNVDEPNRIKIALLKVKLLFNEGQYIQAQAELKPLLPQFDKQQGVQHPDTNTLNIISSVARLAVATESDDADLWLERLQQAIKLEKTSNERHQALLFRLQAQQLQKNLQYTKSKELLDSALEIYHRHVYRRGIAATLEQLAALEQKQQHWELADNYLQRALKIHLWTLNKSKSMQTMQQLIEINNNLDKRDVVQSYTEQLEKLK